MSEIHTILTALKLKLLGEANTRAQIKQSDEYHSLDVEIRDLQEKVMEIQEKQKNLLSGVPDSTDKYQEAKEVAISILKASGEDSIGNLKAKYRVKKQVNTEKLMTGIGGDWDLFQTLAEIKQVRLKEFIKENPDFKGLDKKCVEEIGRELVDVEITLPE